MEVTGFELEGCPFCGSDAVLRTVDGRDQTFWVNCKGDDDSFWCRVSGPHRDTAREAADAWNHRFTFDPAADRQADGIAEAREVQDELRRGAE